MGNISDKAQQVRDAQDRARVNGRFGEQPQTAAADSVGADLKPGLQRVRSFEEIRASYQELAERQKQLTKDEFNLSREELVATILDEFDGATEAVIYNDGEEEGESRYAVSEVRGLDDDGKLVALWEADGDIDGVFGRFMDVAPGMDRFGIDHLAQPADLDHAKAWYGIKI